MKKNKILYLMVMITMLFSFKIDVDADLRSEAEEKSCEDLIKNGTLDTKSETVLFDGSSYDSNCVYVKTDKKGWGLEAFGHYLGKYKDVCLIVQLAWNMDDPGNFKVDSIGKYSSGFQEYFAEDMSQRLDQKYLSDREGVCPIGIKYDDSHDLNLDLDTFFVGASSYNMKRIHATDIDIDVDPLISDLNDPIKAGSCQEIIGEKGISILKLIKSIIQVIIPIMLIVLGSLDFGQAIFAGDENEMKKSQQKFIKRVIFSVAIFLIPVLLKVVLGIAHDIWPVIDNTLCGIYD